jgi:nitroreductase
MSNVINHEEIQKLIHSQLQWRYATKVFDGNKKISEADWETLTESLRLAPSSFGLQPWHFIVANSSALREQLVTATTPINKPKLDTASHILILTRMKSLPVEYIDAYMELVAKTRETPISAVQDYRNMIVNKFSTFPAEAQAQWTTRQTYIALGSLLTSAALLSIDTCAMEGIDPIKCDEVLGLTNTNYGTVVAVALGYRSEEDKAQHVKKVRFSMDQVFTVM